MAWKRLASGAEKKESFGLHVKMEGPIKKRKFQEGERLIVNLDKKLFELVFPWLFFGHYSDRFLAFRTLLALAGTCQQLRYFQNLRRYVAFLAPPIIRERLLDHGFPVPAPTSKWLEVLRSEVFGIGNVLYLWEEALCAVNPFERSWLNVPFYSLAKVCNPDGRVSLVHMPSTFGELCLFSYCIIEANNEELAGFDSIFILPLWKTKESDLMEIVVKLRQNYAQRFLLAKLTRIGTTAPIDKEFSAGPLTETAYSLFTKMCNTNGKKDKKRPIERLKQFVQCWYPMTRHSVGPADRERRAYEFEMWFEN